MFKDDESAIAARLALSLVLLTLASTRAIADPFPDGVSQNLILAPSDNNPRNSEGDFINLKDGRILFIYSHFTGGSRNDSAADLASRVSRDGGKTWTDHDEPVIAAKAHNVANIMSASLLRLKDNRIALFYLVKKSETDARLVVRTSRDEATTWSEPGDCSAGPGYVVVANGRAVQLASGRIIIPAAWHVLPLPPTGFDRGVATCYFSDDSGATWRRSKTGVEAPANSHSGMQHPDIVELKDGRLMMLMAMHLRPLMRSYSTDGGDTWSTPEKTELVSPVSPPSIKRVPSTGDLLLIWNDQSHIDPALKSKRTPLTAAISADEGKTWIHRQNLYAVPDGWYSHAAINFVGDRILLGHCAGEKNRGSTGMTRTVITSFDVGWLYRAP